MTGYTNLYRRGATYYFRVRVPKDIVKSYGKVEEKFSLRTPDKQKAISKWRQASADVDARFAAYRERLRAQSVPLSERVTEQYLEVIREEAYRLALSGHDRLKLKGMPHPFNKGEVIPYSSLANKFKANLAISMKYSQEAYAQSPITFEHDGEFLPEA